MTVGNPSACCPPILDQAVPRTAAVDQLRRVAFDALRSGDAAHLSDLAAATDQDESVVRGVVAQLVAGGTATIDGDAAGDPAVVGAEGLTVLVTGHRLLLAGQSLYTWCAFDTVGIPAALRVDATASTACPTCGAGIELVLAAGQPPTSPVRGWWPEFSGGPVNESFCPTASLFCNAEHLETWRASASAAGEPLTLPQLAERGRATWSLFASPGVRR